MTKLIFYLRSGENGDVEMIVSATDVELDEYRSQFHVTVYVLDDNNLKEMQTYEKLPTNHKVVVDTDDIAIQPAEHAGDEMAYHSTMQFGYE